MPVPTGATSRPIARLLVALTVLSSLILPSYAVAQSGDDLGPVRRCDSIDPANCLFPFPNDFFTRADESTATGRRLDLRLGSMPRNFAGVPINPIDWNRNDGFSPGALVVTKVPGLDTPQALANTDPVTLRDPSRYAEPEAPVVVLDPETGERHPIWTEIDMTVDDPEKRTFLIRPAVNFEEGTRYIVALRYLRDSQGTPIEATEAFKAFRDAPKVHCGGPPEGKPKGQGKGPKKRGDCDGEPAGDSDERADHYQGIFWKLEEAGIDRKDLYLAWDFTVASERNLTERMLHIRDDAFAQLGDTNLSDLVVEGSSPDFTVNTVTENPLGDDGRILRRVEGTVTVPCYLNLPRCPPGSQFAYSSPDATIPLRIPGNTYEARFICNIPSAVIESGPARPSLFGHGLLGQATAVNTRKLYELGSDHSIMFCGADWIGMSNEDIPNDASLLLDLGRFSTLADRMQQAFLNFLYIGRTLIHEQGFSSHPAFQVDGTSVIDATRLYYDGGSQGGIAGGALTAVAPDFTRAALGVPGMNYSILLSRSVDWDPFEEIMDVGYPDRSERQLLFSLIQTLWDRAEANGYAHHMTDDPLPNTPPHEVLLHMAFGDHQVTNWATIVEARTIGAAVRVPELDPGRDPTVDMFWGIPDITAFPYVGSALVVWDVGPLRMENGEVKGTTAPPIENVANREGIDPHGPDASETVEGQLQIATFLMPQGAVIEVCGDHPCYLDGWIGPGP